MKVHLIAALILSFVFVSDASSIIYVDANSPSVPGTGTFESPFRRIQDAIDIAVDGDIVEIRPGVYTGPGNYNLNPAGKSITIRSTEGLNTAASTIIDPNGAGQGVIFYHGEDPNCILSGLTIRNGYAKYDSGGGIFCSNNSHPLITHCIIENNRADNFGGGIYSFDASPEVTHCVIRNNSATDGGGLECSGGAPEITNCIITNNTATGVGGGADFFSKCNPTLTNCTIAKNDAGSGGGLCSTDSQIIIQNSILWQNRADWGTQMAIEPFIYDPNSTASISYSNLQGGQAAIYNPVGVLVWGSGNINADPCFVSFDPNGAPNVWDFHLQSVYGRWDVNTQSWDADLNTSVCIDAGDPNSDWQDEIWPNGKCINMGAYGGTNQASMNGNRADFNLDEVVDFMDFAKLSEQWLVGQTGIEDLTHDGKVDFADLVIFAENWLWQKE